MKIKMCFQQELGVKMFTLFYELIATFNSLSLKKQVHFKTTYISFSFISNIYLMMKTKWKPKYYQYSPKKRSKSHHSEQNRKILHWFQ